MRPLKERIAELLADNPGGITVSAASIACNTTAPYVQKAFEDIAAESQGVVIRRGRAVVLVALGIVDHVCVMCQREYERGTRSKRLTCSKKCAIAYGWKRDPERAERRRASISASKQTPESMARLAAHNKRRWSNPEERERLAAQNRREWKDPEKSAVRAAKIRLNHATPEFSERASKIREEAWADPETRARMEAAIKISKNTPQAKAKFSRLLSDRWKDPAMRAKYIAGLKMVPRLRSIDALSPLAKTRTRDRTGSPQMLVRRGEV